jgi:hypothetical protein
MVSRRRKLKLPTVRFIQNKFCKDIHFSGREIPRRWSGNPKQLKQIVDTFDEWYDPQLNHKIISPFLAACCHKHFDKWWPYFDLYHGIAELVRYCDKHFDKWWPHIKDKLYWETCVGAKRWPGSAFDMAKTNPIIGMIFKYPNKMDQWWEPDKFNWKRDSKYIARFASYEFDTWWDPKRFNWTHCRWLAKYCNQHFDKWWDEKKIQYRRCSSVLAINNSQHFDTWWNEKRFCWLAGNQLIKHCSCKFETWYDAEEFDFTKIDLFIKYANKYKHLWATDAIITGLERETNKKRI